MRAGIVTTLGCAAALLFAAPASAEITQVFTDTATPIDCEVQAGGNAGIRLCNHTAGTPDDPRSTVATWDGVPIDVNVAFPPEPESDPDGPWPVVMLFHGYGGGKLGLGDMKRWLDQGYATFSMTTRGFRESCGSIASREASGGGCDEGWVHLMDTRYEVRDAQTLIAKLVDEELVDGDRIGATGASYGGGMSMALAALNDRIMLPDGSYADWETPDGTDLALAAAAPEVPWIDLSYSLVPNGGNLDYLSDASYFAANDRVGVPKDLWIRSLYAGGFTAPGFYAPSGADPDSDLEGWRDRLLSGTGGFDTDPQVLDIVDEISSHHSSYGIDDSTTAPTPLIISSGWTDDLFPANEAVRYYNRLKTHYPGAPISLNLADFGHPRGQSKSANNIAIGGSENAWFAHYVRGDGAQPPNQVQALTQTCPSSAPPGGPFVEDTYRELAPGEVVFEDDAKQNIATDGTEHGTTFGGTFGGAFPTACVTSAATDTEATANWRLPAAPAGGYTLLGSPTVKASIALAGGDSQIAARLFDVDPGGQQTLVARGLWRPEVSGKETVRQVFQLNPNGYHFAEGHVVKLELAPHDQPYGFKTAQGKVSVEKLRLSLPVREDPGSGGGVVTEPAPKPMPWGEGRDVRLAPDYDDGAPQTFITKGPKGKTNKRNATFDWEWSDIGSTLECSLDGAAFEPCVGPFEINGLKKGKHVFQVRAEDPDHLVDPTPAKRKFNVVK